jgi:hypothetical protein
MPRPPNCPEDVYEVMLRCWEYDPSYRPQWQLLWDWMHKLHSGERMARDTNFNLADSENVKLGMNINVLVH